MVVYSRQFFTAISGGTGVSLRPCNECKLQISSDAKACPHCGKQQAQSMGCGGIGCLAIIVLMLAIALIGGIANSGSKSTNGTSTGSETITPVSPKETALSQVKLTYIWERGGFDSIMMANFTVQNDSDYSIKDFEIKCLEHAKSGTLVDTNDRTVYDIVAAHSKKRFPDFNMGFIHSQAARASCEIVDLVIAQ